MVVQHCCQNSPQVERKLPQSELSSATNSANVVHGGWSSYGVTMKTLTSRLLFVDEDREFLQALREALPGGLYIETVHSVGQALQKLRMGEFDLIGIDLDALKASDANLFQWIRKNQPLTVCVIFTSLSVVAAAAA